MSAPAKKDTHIDDWVGDYEQDKYARWFLFLKRLSAVMQADFEEWIAPFKLFATWKGKRYRVTGASRLGDVWLAKDRGRDSGYDHRVSVDELSGWSPTP